MSSSTDRPNTSSTQPLFRFVWLRRLIIALTILAWMAIGAVVLSVAGRMIGTLILLIAAGLLAYVIYPLVLLLQRFMPRFLAIIVVYLVVLSALSFLIYSMVASVVQQSTSIVLYFQHLLSPQGQRQLQPYIETLNKLGISQDQLTAFGQQIVNQLQGLIGQVIPVVSGIINVLISVVVVAVLSIYLLLDGGRMISWLRNKTPIDQRENINFLVTTVDQTIGGYFRGLLILATIAGISTGIFLALLGVPYAALLAVVVFVFLFIFVILLQQVLIGQILTPRIIGDSMKIHPIVAILALFAGIELLGIGLLGGFIAVPLAGILQTLLIAFWNRWKQTHPEQFPPEETSSKKD